MAEAVRRAQGGRTIVLDGRSGAGKTTLSRLIAARLSARLVSLDEFYPGWGGLAEGGEITARIATSHAAGEPACYRRWDWERGVWADEAPLVEPGTPLIIEGCGALTPASAGAADLAIWVDGDAAERRRRALERDGDTFVPFWEMWREQEETHIARHAPEVLADWLVELRD